MPYKEISDLPKSQVQGYNEHQKRAFLEAFNSAEKEYHDEHQAFAVAHTAAEKAGSSENTTTH
ncbi:MAG: cation transport regulator [Gemmatimonadaceae bacterium]